MYKERYTKMRIRILNLDIKNFPHLFILLKNIILVARIRFYYQNYRYRLPRHHDVPKRMRYKIVHPCIKPTRLAFELTVGLCLAHVLLRNFEFLFYMIFEV
jgi:hypothetical protein